MYLERVVLLSLFYFAITTTSALISPVTARSIPADISPRDVGNDLRPRCGLADCLTKGRLPRCEGQRPICMGACYCTRRNILECDKIDKTQRSIFRTGQNQEERIARHALQSQLEALGHVDMADAIVFGLQKARRHFGRLKDLLTRLQSEKLLGECRAKDGGELTSPISCGFLGLPPATSSSSMAHA